MQADEQTAKDAAERLRAQADLQQSHDTSGLADKLRQVQNEVESRELERTIRLARVRGEVDQAPSDDQTAAQPRPTKD
jgi:hypothetical protein